MNRALQRSWISIRALMRAPGFFATAVLTLGLGIGAATTMFSVVNAILLRPLPYHEPEHLVRIHASNARLGWTQAQVSRATYDVWRQASGAFESVSAYQESGVNMGGAGTPERLSAARISDELLGTLGVSPLLGRAFIPGDEADAVLIGETLWEDRFGRDPQILGRRIQLDGEPHTVVGVMSADFRFPEFAQLWMPLGRAPETSDARELSVIARLSPTSSLSAAATDMERVERNRQAAVTVPQEGWSARVVGLGAERDDGLRPILWLMLGSVIFVLLIACANVGNLLLARLSSRRREMSLLSALGASRSDLVVQLLGETVALVGAATVFGLLVSLWGVALVFAALPSEIPVPAWIRFDLDGRVFLFAIGTAALTVLAVGLLPALQSSRPDIAQVLKAGDTRSSRQRGESRLRRVLVVSEVALSLVLLVGAGLMLRSLGQLSAVDSGIADPEQVLTTRVSLPATRYGSPESVAAFVATAEDAIGGLSGIEGVAAFDVEAPLTANAELAGLEIEGGPRLGEESVFGVARTVVTAGYFRTVGIELLTGRAFESDAGGTTDVVVNEAFAERFLADGRSVGRRLRLGPEGGPWLTVVGIARDLADPRIDGGGVSATQRPVVYLPWSFKPSRALWLAVRTRGEPLDYAPAVQERILRIDPSLPTFQTMTLDRFLSFGTAPFRWMSSVFGVFGVLAFLLASIGLHGVIAFTTGRRTREIGIRMALGARQEDAVTLVVGEGFRLVAVGVGIGIVAAAGLTHFLQTLLYEVAPLDPITFGGMTALLFAMGMSASWLPARRASRMDPTAALREE